MQNNKEFKFWPLSSPSAIYIYNRVTGDTC